MPAAQKPVSFAMQRVLMMLDGKKAPSFELSEEQSQVRQFLLDLCTSMMQEIIHKGVVEEKMQLPLLDQIRKFKIYIEGILCARSFLERHVHAFQIVQIFLLPFNHELKSKYLEFHFSQSYIIAMRSIENFH
ncbi:unnamed protein product [Caenorhabditis angaria]|uniref:Uncharacterized protein n=1 Tax=Caenorhabditis angaria TaxID=860376 RepID=A0A9P1N529_9PELO|nr:unnamed protein product [Caenorhabditis angaria]